MDEAGCAILKNSSRFYCAGDTSGKVSGWAFRYFRRIPPVSVIQHIDYMCLVLVKAIEVPGHKQMVETIVSVILEIE